jgi:hypothetical protein
MGKKITKQSGKDKPAPVYGNPEYSAADDIYNKEKRIDLSDSDEQPVKGITSSNTGEDLDIPVAGLDDRDEIIGEEDEENNYYSLGGDDHEDLEEDKGD